MGEDGGSKSAGVVGSCVDAKGGSGRTLGRTILCYGPSLKFGVATAFAFAWGNGNSDPDPGSTASPSSDPQVDAPLFVLNVLDLLPKRSLPRLGEQRLRNFGGQLHKGHV